MQQGQGEKWAQRDSLGSHIKGTGGKKRQGRRPRNQEQLSAKSPWSVLLGQRDKGAGEFLQQGLNGSWLATGGRRNSHEGEGYTQLYPASSRSTETSPLQEFQRPRHLKLLFLTQLHRKYCNPAWNIK